MEEIAKTDITEPTGKEGEIKTEGEGNESLKKDEITIPKYRFDEVNASKKQLETELEALRKEKKDKEEAKLLEDGKVKEVYELKLKELQEEKELLKREKFEAKKESLVVKYGIPDKFVKLVTGETFEELEASALEVSEDLKELIGTITVTDKKETKMDVIPEKKGIVEKQNSSPNGFGKHRDSIFDALKNAKTLN